MPSSVTTLKYRARFTQEEFEQIKRGFVPKAMEDKWFICFEDGTLYFHRSWTGVCVFSLKLVEENGRFEAAQALLNSELELTDLSYQAELLDYLIRRLLLKQDAPFPKPGGIFKRLAGVFQHHVSGTGYSEK